MKKIEAAVMDVKKAKEKVKNLLAEKWPLGSTIQCIIRRGQKVPSKMEVIGYSGYGLVRVKMESKRS